MHTQTHKHKHNKQTQTLLQIYDLYQGVRTFFNIPLTDKEKKTESQLSRQHMITVTKKHSLQDAMEIIHRGKVHRVFEVDENGKLLSLISLSDMLRNFL